MTTTAFIAGAVVAAVAFIWGHHVGHRHGREIALFYEKPLPPIDTEPDFQHDDGDEQ